MKQTTCCVRCGKPAKFHRGYVLLGGRKALAGWCSRCCLNSKGFYGHVQEWMPLEDA